MKTQIAAFIVLSFVITLHSLSACTNVLVTKGASVDGSVMITYTADAAGFCPKLAVFPAATHPEGTVIEIPAAKDRPAATIKQVPQTYHVIGVTWEPEPGMPGGFWTRQGLINEHQLAITETTFGGHSELVNPKGLINYPMLITFALERAKTAREAIDVMTQLVKEYGYNDGGESISIADKNEAWVFEIVGTGNVKDASGAIWVAKKVPDGEISVHANQARIGEIPDVPNREECFYSENIKTFAIENGWYAPNVNKPFRFDEVYDDITPGSKRVCASRVWSVFRRAAPSQNFSPDYHRGKPDAVPYPWSIKPDKKLSASDVLALKRDHYEGTDFDMTKGIDAGEYGLPLRWRPLYWTVAGNDREYAWERPIATQQTGFSVVSQSRSNLPDCIGGVLWFGMDDCYLNCHFPLYCNITEVPASFAKGSITQFSWESAWWVFNLTANYANLKYSRITPDIIAVQKELESFFFKMQSAMDEKFTEVLEIDANLARQYQTNYSVSQGELVYTRWKKLAESIFTKFNDGYIRSADGTYPKEGDPYPADWLRHVLKERPEQFKVPE